MNIVLVVLCAFMGLGTILPVSSLLWLAAMADNPDAMAFPLMCIAGGLCLIVGAVMARKNKPHAVKVLWASTVLYVFALCLDDLGFYQVAMAGGIIWSAIAAVCTMRTRKKLTEVKEG